ncbi:unnamed protein product, partial [Iphiclides podalirius]
MLIRTKSARGKFRTGIAMRVSLFFGIPLSYFLFASAFVQNTDVQTAAPPSAAAFEGFTSRRLLALVTPAPRNCTKPAILEFPSDGLTRAQRKSGFVLVHCLLAVYCFLLLGSVCEQYFVPAIEIICERLAMASDIAGATFMAAASSSPELFINCVGTFVTEGDLGVGAVVGSAVFNVLAVPACCALVAGKAVELDWWSVSRDCLMYAVAVVALILTLMDNVVQWHEALLLVLMYTLYILAMVFNGRLGSFFRSGCCGPSKSNMYTEITPLLVKEKRRPLEAPASKVSQADHRINDLEQGSQIESSSDSGISRSMGLLWWGVRAPLWATIPDCRTRTTLWPLTFGMCVVWIGAVSYLVAWIITILGDTLDVPDSITGLTILAAGTSLPEAVSSVLVTNRGQGTMGISNSIGSNTFDILLCLGLPWLVKGLLCPSVPGNHWISINSSGLSYSAICLLSTLFVLYGALFLNGFRLDWRVGVTCALVYAAFLAMATLIELNFIFPVNLPICPH